MLHARIGDTLYFHGAPASRLLKLISVGHPICAAFTLLDGLVLARSAFHHSVNYRSAVIFGTGKLVASDEEKLAALEALTEHIAPGRWADARQPNRKELDATSVIALRIESASAKIRTGPPSDDEADYALPIWAGVLPLQLQGTDPHRRPEAERRHRCAGLHHAATQPPAGRSLHDRPDRQHVGQSLPGDGRDRGDRPRDGGGLARQGATVVGVGRNPQKVPGSRRRHPAGDRQPRGRVHAGRPVGPGRGAPVRRGVQRTAIPAWTCW